MTKQQDKYGAYANSKLYYFSHILYTHVTSFLAHFNVGQPLFCTHAFCRHKCRIYLQDKTQVNCKVMFNNQKEEVEVHVSCVI